MTGEKKRGPIVAEIDVIEMLELTHAAIKECDPVDDPIAWDCLWEHLAFYKSYKERKANKKRSE